MDKTREDEIDAVLRQFVRQSQFVSAGGVVTDLDGTAVHEESGKTYLPPSVELGLKAIYDAGRPVVVNSLRFPLSVMRTFGKEWLAISRSPIPVVSMNGSQLGWITTDSNAELVFEEVVAFPLSNEEIDSVLNGVRDLVDGGIRDVLLFYYPRSWRMGEIIWTPVAEKVIHVKEKYTSASAVTAVEFEKLSEQMHQEEICMIFLLIERVSDELMAYQHARPSSFFTRKGIDKLTGAREIAQRIGFDLVHSVGAGDTAMDCFLSGVGLALHVGDSDLDFLGLNATLRLKNSFELGEVLFRLARLVKETVL